MSTDRPDFGRRRLLAAPCLAAVAAAPATLLPAAAWAQAARQPLRPRRLQPGDTVALINPSSAVYERAPYEVATETLQSLGF
ncbi:MAG TPA: hypothetical protein VEZ89_07120, partial [Rubrivivax sp.]|nr:hypothetical protein [Rubrivivax sp.]